MSHYGGSHHRGYAMDTTTVVIGQMSQDVIVNVASSNAIVTRLMKVVQRNGGAWDNRGYAMGTIPVVIGRTKSFVSAQNFIVRMMSALKG